MVAIAVQGVIELPQGWLGKGVHVGPFEASSIRPAGCSAWVRRLKKRMTTYLGYIYHRPVYILWLE
jgi:hypothetical protein